MAQANNDSACADLRRKLERFQANTLAAACVRHEESTPLWFEICALLSRGAAGAKSDSVYASLKAALDKADANSPTFTSLARRVLAIAEAKDLQYLHQLHVDGNPYENITLFHALRAATSGASATAWGDFRCIDHTKNIRIGMMLVQGKEANAPGVFAQIVIEPLYVPGCNLALVRHPKNQLQVFDKSFLESIQTARDFVRRQFTDQRALYDIGLVYSIGYDPSASRPFAGISSDSAGAAFALGIALALRRVAPLPPQQRSLLQRIDAEKLSHLALSATFDASGALGAVGGLVHKADAYFDARKAANLSAVEKIYVAKSAEGSRHEASYARVANWNDLLNALAEAHHPRSQGQAAFIDAIANGEPPSDDAITSCIAEEATDLITHLAKRVATYYAERERGKNLISSFVPLTLSRPTDDPGADASEKKEKRNIRYGNLAQLLGDRSFASAKGFTLVGDPGAGKSTLLQAYELETATAAIAQLVRGDKPEEICVYIPLKYLEAKALSEEGDSSHGSVALKALLKPRDQASVLPEAICKLLEGQSAAKARVRFLLDGVNEITARDQGEWEQRAARLADIAMGGFDPNRVRPLLFATRSHQRIHLGDSDHRVFEVNVDPWTAVEIEEYLNRRFPAEATAASIPIRAKADALLRRVKEDEHTRDLFSLPINLAAQCELFEEGIDAQSNRAELFGLWFWKKARREWNRVAHARSPALMRAFDGENQSRLNVNSEVWKTRGLDLPQGLLIEALETLAWWQWRGLAQEGKADKDRGQVAVSFDELRNVLPEARFLRDETNVQEVIAVAASIGIIQLSREIETVSFAHQLWGEFFAARGLAREWAQPGGMSEATQQSLQLVQFERSDIEEIAALNASGDDDAKLITNVAGPLDESALFAIETLADTAAMARAIQALQPVNLTLAARCALRVRSRLEGKNQYQCWDKSAELDKKYGAANETLKAHRAELLRRFTKPVLNPNAPDDAASYEDIRHRHEWGLALGDLGGDPRYELREGEIDGKPVPYLRPKDAFICLVGKKGKVTGYWIGDETRKGGQEDGRTLAKVSLKGFTVSAFPVTNAEFRFFVEAGCYEQSQWWGWERSAAERWRLRFVNERSAKGKPTQPRDWEYNERGNGLQPVIGITWFEANAYAAWLHALEGASSGNRISLLTEGQWHAAAGGSGKDFGPDAKRHRRRWPYAATNGEQSPEEDPLRINFEGTRLRTTSPVGLFPRGASSEGIEDLGGNVWELTASERAVKLSEKTLAHGLSNESSAPERVALAGGVYWKSATYCRSTSRYYLVPEHVFDACGFRVCGLAAPIKRFVDTEP